MSDPVLQQALAQSSDLEAVLNALLTRLKYHHSANRAVFYVAGAISADGDDRIPHNISLLRQFRDQVATLHLGQAFAFCGSDIFTQAVLTRLGLLTQPRDRREEQLRAFWGRTLESKLVDGIYLAPGWQRSPGAAYEHATAQRLAIPVNYL